MPDTIISCPSCGTSNRIPAAGRTGRPVCGSCRSPLSKSPLHGHRGLPGSPSAWWRGIRPLHKWAVGVGAFCALWSLVALFIGVGAGPFGEPDLEQVFSETFNEHRQSIFDSIHPLGTAKSVTVHHVGVNWREGSAGTAPNDAESVTVTFTVFWEGPITRDGYTKMRASFDLDLQDFTHWEIVVTNGVTNEELGYAAGAVFGMALRHALGW